MGEKERVKNNAYVNEMAGGWKRNCVVQELLSILFAELARHFFVMLKIKPLIYLLVYSEKPQENENPV